MKRKLTLTYRPDVERVLDYIDAVGEEPFLAEHGFGRSLVYRIAARGRTYPSKAVLGVAAGLGPTEFFGGVAQTVGRLQSLGYTVLRGRRRVPPLRLVRRAAWIDVDVADAPDLPEQPVACFASGSNRPGEIRGLAAAGVDVGVAAPEVSAAAEDELAGLAGSDVNVFVDSGAFSEVRFGPEGPEVVDEITAAEWRKRLDLCERLGRALGDQVWIVAPDRVGSQAKTIERLRRYAERIRLLRATGARILVPLQRGELTLEELARVVDSVLWFTDWIPALPCKKAATSPGEVEVFVRERRPAHVHLLGLGPRNRRAAEYLEPFVGDDRPTVSLDSNWIAANVGLRPRPRRYTRAREQARRILGAAAAGAVVSELAILACFGV